jgi:DNA repair exonuclease SbcCD nuclease subunit
MTRFIHAADIHLDSPLLGLSAYQGAPVEVLRSATRSAFTRLIDVAIEEEVDFLVIAGDLYDGTWKDFNTGIYFARQMGRLAKAGIPAFLLYGNHDAESEITKQLTLPPNVKAFSSRKAETHRIENLEVALHGRSFREAATTENLAVDYPAAIPGWLNIGVLHTALEGDAAHAT